MTDRVTGEQLEYAGLAAQVGRLTIQLKNMEAALEQKTKECDEAQAKLRELEWDSPNSHEPAEVAP